MGYIEFAGYITKLSTNSNNNSKNTLLIKEN